MIGFIGSGKMAEALIRAFLKKYDAKDIFANDVNSERLEYLKKFGINVSLDKKDALQDITFLCVKPQDIEKACEEILPYAKDELFVSIAAGIKLEKLETLLPNKRVIRVMPNTPCIVGEMAAGFSKGKLATDKDSNTIKTILDLGGVSFELNEDKLDAVTGLSGSGPAFVAYFADAMINAGIQNGLDENISRDLALQTIKGTAKLLQETNLDPDELIKMVRSPNGTTHEGMNTLEKSEFHSLIIKAITDATKRSEELGK